MKEHYDIAIIGGGISGLGVAREAASWGFDVALFERGTLGEATSANSLRIIHGGIRYLQSLNFVRVVESSAALRELLVVAPGIVKVLPCLMPIEGGCLRGRAAMQVAGWLYRTLTNGQGEPSGEVGVCEAHELRNLGAILQERVAGGAFLWHDALLLDHSGLVSQIRREAEKFGAEIYEQHEVRSLEQGQHWGVQLRDRSSISARVVVNTAGPWIGRLLPANAPPELHKLPRGWCQALNAELSFQLDPRYAIGVKGQSGRLFFFVPRGARTVVGTWYYPLEGALQENSLAQPPEKEMEAFLGEASAALGVRPFGRSDVVSVEQGVLPMKSVGRRGPVLYGRQEITAWQGLLQVLSTKYTTFLVQAREVMQSAKPFLKE